MRIPAVQAPEIAGFFTMARPHPGATEWKREIVYSFGAAEGLLLDRLNPNWKTRHFARPFSLDSFLDN
jgi:hypothetical protein